MRVCAVLCVSIVLVACNDGLPPGRLAIGRTNIVDTKQGKVQGYVVQIEHNLSLRYVDTFLGIPYAAPPTGNQRFMPPGSPPQWFGLKTADTYPPVCPQALHRPAEKSKKPMSRGRTEYLARLSSFMQHQSEDCLYLNIYAPHEEEGPFMKERKPIAVIVYIHGESFQWNAGHPYDGSVLASYGDVIVVTINFRLGILGFLKPGAGDNTPSNFGLLDQLAALQWVRDNIAQFGGDSGRVTLMGHGTGAACINYLMVSPVAQGVTGLFHRAILMSGTALADWALVTNPLHFTLQVANALNCPESSEEMGDCLRRKRLHEIMAVQVYASDFKTPFGPVIDGTVVPNEPSKIMGTYKDLFSRYEMLYGMSELESYHLLDAVSLAHGMLEEDQRYMLRNYLQAKFELLPDIALAKTTQQYVSWKRSSGIDHRNNMLDILSDARVAAPIIQMGNYHSQANNNSYLYVFKHISKFGDFPNAEKSVHGEELPYVFGVPLDGSSPHFQNNYSVSEKLLSEVIMTMWSNFAKFGNPKAKSKLQYLNQGPREWMQYNIGWPKYNTDSQAYYSLGIPPEIKHYYRRDKMIFWNDLLPTLLTNSDYQQPFQPKSPTWVVPEPSWKYTNRYKPSVDIPIEPGYKRIQSTTNTTHVIHPYKEENTFENDVNQNTFDVQDEKHPPPLDVEDNMISTASSLTLTIVIFVGIFFLLFNLCAFVGLHYQRDKLRVRERLANARYGCNLGIAEEEEVEEQYTKKEPTTLEAGKDIKSILKSSESIYEQVKASSGKSGTEGRKHGKWSGISRQASSSTVTIDPHTKVREWIAQEVVQRCSPRKAKKLDQKADSSDIYGEPSNNTIDSNMSRMGVYQRQKVQKVSVAIDATPATRSASVLQQTPIELTKSLDEGKNSNGLGSLKTSTSLVTILKRPSLQRTDAFNSDGSSEKVSSNTEPIRKCSSINLKMSSESIPTVVHFHSKSDPAEPKTSTSRLDNIHLTPAKSEALYSRVNKNQKHSNNVFSNSTDVNVTSLDDLRSETSHCSHEEMLDHIKRRNFPKVLPDFPNNGDETHFNKSVKRRSLPLCSHLAGMDDEDGAGSMQLHSLKIPPAPPPRVSTLGRKPNPTTNPASSFTTTQANVRLKAEHKSQVPIPVKSPQVPVVHPTTIQQSQTRSEPKIVIRPTMACPVSSRKERNIPRVTHNVSPSPPPLKSQKITAPVNRVPETKGIGKRTKIPPVKKTVSTEAALDAQTTPNRAATVKK